MNIICKCKHPHQDKKYGLDVRIHEVYAVDGQLAMWRCRNCGDLKPFDEPGVVKADAVDSKNKPFLVDAVTTKNGLFFDDAVTVKNGPDLNDAVDVKKPQDLNNAVEKQQLRLF